MPSPVLRSPKTIAVVATVTTVGAAATYSRVVLPWHAARLAEIRRLNGDLTVGVERSGGGI